SVHFALETTKDATFKKDPMIIDALKIPPETALDAALDTSHHDPLAAQSLQPMSDATVEAAAPGRHSSVPTTTPAGTINVKTCRVCSNQFTYELPDGDVKIICGVPGKVQYKAISYVWGR